jgi:hypothetical protein
VTYTTISESEIWHVLTIHLPYSSWLITSILSLILVAFCRFFTWNTLGNVGLCFSLILVTNANAEEWGSISAALLHHHRNQSIHMTDGVAVTSFTAGLQLKASAAMGHPC